MGRGQREGGIPRRRTTPLVSVSLDAVTWDALQIIAASQSLYALYTATQGAGPG